jgi:hypothetical protein
MIVAAHVERHRLHSENTGLVQLAGGRPQGDLPVGHGLEPEIQSLRTIHEGHKELASPAPTWRYSNQLKENQAAVAEQQARTQRDAAAA